MSETSFDTSGLDRLAADIGAAALGVAPLLEKALGMTSKRVKDDWNGKLYSDGHARLTGRSISYDVTVSGPTISAEIGAKRGEGRQAGIVRLLENGSVHNAPHGFGSAALGENEADFEARLAFAVWAGQERHGL